MYAHTVSSSRFLQPDPRQPYQRINAAAAVSFKCVDSRTKLDRLYQQGSAKIRFPKQYGDFREAVLINTAGGLTGGDRLGWDISLGERCNAVVTSQACEKSYKSTIGTAHVQTSINLKAGSALHWLPQETILYEGSSLCRNLSVDMAEDAELLALECIVLGREAMGEAISKINFRDRWRIRRDGETVFADDLRLNGSEQSTAGFGAHRAVASLLYVGDKNDESLQAMAARLRQVCPAKISGFSAFNGKVTGRILAADSYELRQALVPVMNHLRNTDLPSVWRI